VGQQLKPTGKAKTSCPSVSEGNTGLKRFFETLWVPSEHLTIVKKKGLLGDQLETVTSRDHI
jgi:hypothetical protein